MTAVVLAGLPPLAAGIAGHARGRIRYAPVVVLGVLVITATSAFAQPEPIGSPYMGTPPNGLVPVDTGVYVDPPPYVDPPLPRPPEAVT